MKTKAVFLTGLVVSMCAAFYACEIPGLAGLAGLISDNGLSINGPKVVVPGGTAHLSAVLKQNGLVIAAASEYIELSLETNGVKTGTKLTVLQPAEVLLEVDPDETVRELQVMAHGKYGEDEFTVSISISVIGQNDMLLALRKIKDAGNADELLAALQNPNTGIRQEFVLDANKAAYFAEKAKIIAQITPLADGVDARSLIYAIDAIETILSGINRSSAGNGQIPDVRVVRSLDALQALLLSPVVFENIIVDGDMNGDINGAYNYSYARSHVNIPPGRTVIMSARAKFTNVMVLVRPGAQLYIEEAGQTWAAGTTKVIIRPGATLGGVTNFYKGIGDGGSVLIFPGANIQKGTVSIENRAVLGNLNNEGSLLTVEGTNGSYLAFGPHGAFNIGIPANGQPETVQYGDEGSFNPALFSYDTGGDGTKYYPPSKITIHDSIELGAITDLSARTAAPLYTAPPAGFITVQAPATAHVVFHDMTLTYNGTATPFPIWLDSQNGQGIFIKQATLVGAYNEIATGQAVFGSVKRAASDTMPLTITGGIKLGGELMATVPAAPVVLTPGSRLTILKDAYLQDSGEPGAGLAARITFTADTSFMPTDGSENVNVHLSQTSGAKLNFQGSGIVTGGLTASYLASGSGYGSYNGLDVAAYTFNNFKYTKGLEAEGIAFTLAGNIVDSGDFEGSFNITGANGDEFSLREAGSALRVSAGANAIAMKGVTIAQTAGGVSNVFKTPATLSTTNGNSTRIGLALANGREMISFYSGGEIKLEGLATVLVNGETLTAADVSLKTAVFTGAADISPGTPAVLTVTNNGLQVPAKITLAAGGNDPIAVKTGKTLTVNGTLELNGMIEHKTGVIDVSGGELKFTGSTQTLLKIGEANSTFNTTAALKLKGPTALDKTMNFGTTGTEGISWTVKPRIELYGTGTATGGKSVLQIGPEIFTVSQTGNAAAPARAVIENTLSLGPQTAVTYSHADGAAAVFRTIGGGNQPTVRFSGTTLAESATLRLFEAGVGTPFVDLGSVRAVNLAGSTQTNATVAMAAAPAGGAAGVPKVILNPVRAGIAVANWSTAGFFGSASIVSAAVWTGTTTAKQAAVTAEVNRAGPVFNTTPVLSATWVWVQGQPAFTGSNNSGWIYTDNFVN